MRTMDEVVEEVRALPVADRLRLVELIIREVADASAARGLRPSKVSPFGWLSGEPEVAEELEKLTADIRARGTGRELGDEDPR